MLSHRAANYTPFRNTCAPQKVDPALIARVRPTIVGCFWPVFFFADHTIGRGGPVLAAVDAGAHQAVAFLDILGNDLEVDRHGVIGADKPGPDVNALLERQAAPGLVPWLPPTWNWIKGILRTETKSIRNGQERERFRGATEVYDRRDGCGDGRKNRRRLR